MGIPSSGDSGYIPWSAATICKFLDALKLEQTMTDTKFCNTLMRNPPSPRQKKWVQLDASLQDVVEHYNDCEVLRYLILIGYLIAS